jgi:hypothetical protein
MTTQRRTLDFRSFDDVRAEVARLAAGPYSRCGKWELATTCDHLAKAFELGLGDRTIAVPRFVKILGPVAGPLILRRVLKKRAMPTGVRAPVEFVPSENCDAREAVDRLNEILRRAEALPGPMPRHPFFGAMTVGQWKDLMLIHCSHHLSFLVPQ